MGAIRYSALVAVIAIVASGAAASGGSVEAQFTRFKAKFGRHYATPEEERDRMAIYAANLRRAGELQRRNPLAVYSENAFADVTPKEFKSRHNSARKIIGEISVHATAAPTYTPLQLTEMPRRVDWRERGAVTPVKDQGDCGACWAFSVTGNVEGQWFLAGHELIPLSEQELVSCELPFGCDGGNTGEAMDWIVQVRAGWLTSEADYPYASANGSKPACVGVEPGVAQIYGRHTVASDENQMAAYLAANGPLSICVNSSTWQSYASGIMQNCPRGDDDDDGDDQGGDHCVLAVGYNLNATTPYWIIKNSWGEDWGDAGYAYVGFGSNECGITAVPNNVLIRHATVEAAAYASTRVELWTMYRFVSNFGVMLRAPRIPGTRDLVAASFIELAVTIAALCAAPWHPTLGRGLVGATAGLVVGHLCLAVGNVRLGPWYTVLPLLVCPAVMAALCVKFRRVALSSAGAVIAVWLLSVAAFEYTSRSVDVVRPWMLYVLLGIAAVCAYLATLSPKRTRCAFEVLLAATCGCAAVIQLIGPLVSGGTWSSLTSARSDCGYAVNEAVYVAAVLVCAVVRNRVMWRVEAAAARSCVTQERDEEMLYGSA